MAEIRKRRSADGTFRYDVRTRIGERQVSKTFRRRKDADAYATTLEADRLRGISVDPRQARRPVGTVAKHWVASNPTKRPTTRVADDLALRLYILPQLGTRPVGEVVPADVQALVNDWSSHLAPRTVRRHYGVLRAVFAHAIANDWIGRSPCRNVKLPPVTTTRRRHLGTKEVTAIARAMPSDHRPIVWLGAVLGLRWSEIAGLRVGRLDLLAGTVTIAEAVTRGEGGRLVCGTRSREQAGARSECPRRSRRCLPIILPVEASLERIPRNSSFPTTQGDRSRIPTGVGASGSLHVALPTARVRAFTIYDAPTPQRWWSRAWT